MRRLACFAIAATCLAAPAFAEAPMPSPEDVANRDTFTLAGGVGIVPDYEGSNDYRMIPVAAIRGQYHGISFSTRGTYLYADFVPRAGKMDFDLGPIVGMRLNNRKHIDDEVVDLLPELDNVFEAGVFAGVGIHGITNPYDTLAFRLDVIHGFGNSHNWTNFSPNVEFSTPLSRTTYVGVNLGAEFASHKFADYYFAVSPADRVASGNVLPVFEPDAGLKNWKVGLLVNQSITGDLLGGLSIFGTGQYSHLVGDFKRSPLVSDRGSAGQWLGAAGLAYTW